MLAIHEVRTLCICITHYWAFGTTRASETWHKVLCQYNRTTFWKAVAKANEQELRTKRFLWAGHVEFDSAIPIIVWSMTRQEILQCNTCKGRCAADTNSFGVRGRKRLDSTTGESTGAPFAEHSRAVSCVSISRDGLQIVSGSMDGTIRQRDGSTNERTGAPLLSVVSLSPQSVFSGEWSDERDHWKEGLEWLRYLCELLFI